MAYDSQAIARSYGDRGLPEHQPGDDGRPAATLHRHFEPGYFDSAMWLAEPRRDIDIHVGFRTSFRTEAGEHTISVQASSVFRVWLDDEVLVSGPLRFVPAVPEYHSQIVTLTAGEHSLAIHAVGDGIMSRTTAPIPPFVMCRVASTREEVVLEWVARELTHFAATELRVSPLLGWMEWQQTPDGTDWRSEQIAAAEWAPVVCATGALEVLGVPTSSDLDLPQWPRVPLREIARGRYREIFTGYKYDDPAVQFMLAQDDCGEVDSDGVWIRYDLERIRIGSVELTVRLNQPGDVTIAYAERLGPDGRPVPVVPLSTGPTRMIQHYTLGAGTTYISPLQTLGGRWIEVRIQSQGKADILSATFVERDILGAAIGSFDCDDATLGQIWSVGIDTIRSSAEDSLVDSARERGEWLGDVISSALQILAAGWGDSRLVRRALLHAAAGARSDGLVAGCGPGEMLYVGTYSAQWVTACLQVALADRSTATLKEFEDAANANLRALVGNIREDGTHNLPWCFVDWGYQTLTDEADAVVLSHIVMAINSWISWQEMLHPGMSNDVWERERDRLSELVMRALPTNPSPYHAYTLAATAHIIPQSEAVKHIVTHLDAGFPFNPDGHRLRDPEQVRPGAITPYFTNYSIPILLEQGLGEYVAEKWSTGWGWMLSQGATTWWEVFDDRWSRCHYWSGAPTWQLSQYCLGLRTELSPAGGRLAIGVNTLGLRRASGVIPLGVDRTVGVDWSIESDATMSYRLDLPSPQLIRWRGEDVPFNAGRHTILLRPVGRGDRYE